MFNDFQTFRWFLRRPALWLCLCATVLAGPVWAGTYDDFFKALERDDHATVRKLVAQGFDPNTTGPSGLMALHLALMERSFKVAEVLIDAPHSRWDRRNPSGETPLMLAALRSQLALVKALVAKGADINTPGWTPLHYAVIGEGEATPEVVRLLLANGAKTDVMSPTGTTPLMLATLYGPEDSITLLLQAKANPMLLNNAGRTAMDLADSIGREGAKKLLLAGVQRWQREQAAQAAGAAALESLRQSAHLPASSPLTSPASTSGQIPAASK